MSLHDAATCAICERVREMVAAGDLTCVHTPPDESGECELCTMVIA